MIHQRIRDGIPKPIAWTWRYLLTEIPALAMLACWLNAPEIKSTQVKDITTVIGHEMCRKIAWESPLSNWHNSSTPRNCSLWLIFQDEQPLVFLFYLLHDISMTIVSRLLDFVSIVTNKLPFGKTSCSVWQTQGILDWDKIRIEPCRSSDGWLCVQVL